MTESKNNSLLFLSILIAFVVIFYSGFFVLHVQAQYDGGDPNGPGGSGCPNSGGGSGDPQSGGNPNGNGGNGNGGTGSGGGSGGGAPQPDPIPDAPVGLSASCPVPGTAATLSWTSSKYANYYEVRADNSVNGWSGLCDGAQNLGDICQDVNKGTTLAANTNAGATFSSWWVHACNASGCSEPAPGGSFQCYGTGSVQGYKFPPTNPVVASQTVKIDGVLPTTWNPYSFQNITVGNHIVSVTTPAGYSVGYTLCYAPNFSCHNNAPTPGNTATVNITSAGVADLWWHFTSTSGKPQCSNLVDDDGDGKIDVADPDCHTDGNAGNPATYDPNDNNEAGAAPICLLSSGASSVFSPLLAQAEGTPASYSQSYVVPSGTKTLTVKVWGAGGGGSADAGGAGGYAESTINATPGETLTVIVATGGENGHGACDGHDKNGGSGGVPGGGKSSQSPSQGMSGAGGGGYSGVFRGGTQLVIAGGGGGGAANGNCGTGRWGGAGGGSSGQASGEAGKPGTQFAGGTDSTDATRNGGSLFGGKGPGGGGAGHFGGAGAGGGGGGSGYTSGSSNINVAGSGAAPSHTNDSNYQASGGTAGRGGIAGDSHGPGGNGLIVITPTIDSCLVVGPPKPACSDLKDNDGDLKKDSADPGCHSDNNAGNPGSYNPNDNNEADACVANVGQICLSAPNNQCVPSQTNPGQIQCDGTCNATTPTNAGCSLPTISCGSVPGGSCSKLINQGNSCLIEWNATNATSCSVSGPGLNQTGLPTTGSVQTPVLNVTSIYTITCYNGPAVYVARTFTCRINPKEQEI